MSFPSHARKRPGLILQIIIGLSVGALGGTIAALVPSLNAPLIGIGSFVGGLFVDALRAVAPLLVFVLMLAAISRHHGGNISVPIRPILTLYLCGTFLAALTAVSASFLFPSTLSLQGIEAAQRAAPEGIGEVLLNLAKRTVDNPVNALLSANYIGLIAWGVALGMALRHAGEQTRALMQDMASAVSQVVRWVIRLAPLGVMGLIMTTIAKEGFDGIGRYLHLLFVLVGAMVFVALVLNPLLVFWQTRRNPYPLVFTCLRESGVTAFFTRSSAANIPVNMALCKKLGLHEDTYSISIPLGATINMAGAAITITVLTLAAVNTIGDGMHIDFTTALLLSVVASLGACGASGVAGGSLLLIPMACSLFKIDNEIAMQVVSIGVVISVIQDSVETALNSSTDVLFTAAADYRRSLQETPTS